MNYLLVFIGGGLGSTLRHLVNVVCPRLLGTAFPYHTFIINITGSIIMGLIARLSRLQGRSVTALAPVFDDRRAPRLHHLLGVLARSRAALRAPRDPTCAVLPRRFGAVFDCSPARLLRSGTPLYAPVSALAL